VRRVESYEARIFVGLRECYDGETHDVVELEDCCQRFCDKVGLCVTVTPTTFVYKDGREPGAVVGLINYPRFPKTFDAIRELADELGTRLKVVFKQLRVTIWTPRWTFMIGEME
jgi:hypothetical protein